MTSRGQSELTVEKESEAAISSDYDRYFEIPNAEIGTDSWQEAYDALVAQVTEDLQKSTLSESDIGSVLESLYLLQQIISATRATD